MLPDDLAGLDAIELGCGTAYVSAWMARRGARPVGIDNSAKQLETAARLQREHGIEFPLIHGNAERVPYPDASFDFAISEYGAVLWADPEAWVPEAARLLRPGGRLHVLTNHVLAHPRDRGGRRRGRSHRGAPGAAARSGRPAWRGPMAGAWSSIRRTASGSGCSDRPASRSRPCWSRRCRRGPRPGTSGHPTSGPAGGRSRRSGRSASAAEPGGRPPGSRVRGCPPGQESRTRAAVVRPVSLRRGSPAHSPPPRCRSDR